MPLDVDARLVGNPQENPNATEDAYKTLFITRLDYNVTEDQLKKELSNCGPVKSVHIVKDQKTSKPRGYAFVEFEHEKDLKRMDFITSLAVFLTELALQMLTKRWTARSC